VAHALRRRGIDVLTATDVGLLGAPDPQVLARSYAAGRVVVTQDDDYLRLHHRQHAHAGIAYCEQGARSIGQMIAALVLIYEVLTADEMEGRVEYL
jgi:predicted nuclease of predicted toxin-antitoxin system